MHPRLKALAEKPWQVALLLGVAALILFSFHIGIPSKPMFDEVHYLPAAQALIDQSAPRNAEHPLVGKELIALGMLVFGDTPYGWRVMPSLAGAATVIAAFALLWLLTRRMRPAVVGALLLMLNQLLFVLARIAMLDVFLGAFLLWAMVALTWSMKAGTREQALRRWIAGSVLLGLAVGVKWAAIPYVALAGLAFLVIRLRDARLARRPLATAITGKDQPHGPGLATIPALLIMGAVSIAVYLLTFLPAFFYAERPLTLATLIPFQQEMYALQTQVLKSHPYQSSWWSWPLLLRPVWAFYEFYNGAWRGVLVLGNPLIMWGGLLGVGACIVAWFKSRAIVPLAMALLWTASLAIYIVIPKSLGFYYYYHLSAIFLCLALAVAFDHFDRGRKRGREEWFLAASLLVFAYFYPIIAAMPLADGGGFNRWMWEFGFNNWR
ncbi:MAG: phospholipid carrier-dependent glycosyltransferase [Pseudomonadota bacterium]